MATAEASVNLPVSPDAVWDLIGGFGGLPDWLPNILDLKLSDGGRVRTLAVTGGVSISERLTAYDRRSRSYTYEIVQSPFPVKDYLSTLQVEDIEDGKMSRVTWSGRFTPTSGREAEAVDLFQKLYDDGLHALQRKIKGTDGHTAEASSSI